MLKYLMTMMATGFDTIIKCCSAIIINACTKKTGFSWALVSGDRVSICFDFFDLFRCFYILLRYLQVEQWENWDSTVNSLVDVFLGPFFACDDGFVSCFN